MDDSNWRRFCRYLFKHEELGLQLDISKIRFGDEYWPYAKRMIKSFFRWRSWNKVKLYNPDEKEGRHNG
jgi:hypothetical protein